MHVSDDRPQSTLQLARCEASKRRYGKLRKIVHDHLNCMRRSLSMYTISHHHLLEIDTDQQTIVKFRTIGDFTFAGKS